ncbi:helix-turn-helix domain-containing protein [Kitasatospora sp. NPDC127116]|uniref:helix-turn-helix domain-containing protein n=1 Tax=Kitasatospora sp. NPDC127116 TaxID=3345367 RepID=UPI00362DC136
MRVEHAVPGPALRPWIDRYWWYRAGPGDLPRLLPGTGAELWIHWAGGVHLDDGAGPVPLPAAHLVCLRGARWEPVSREAGGFVAVRFRAGALRHFLAPGVDEVADRVVSAAEVWGPPARRMAEQVCLASGPAEQAAVLDRALAELLAAHDRADPWLDAAVRLVHRRPGEVRVDALAEHLGVTVRRLQRAFPAAVGAGPKAFQRVARFQRLTRTLLLSGERRYLPGALAAGYYDQAHFVREFRHFTGRPPTALLGQGLSHFYYERLPAPRQAGP